MNRWLPILLFAAAAALVPLAVRSNATLNFLVMALLFAYLGQAWNVLGGYAGQFSFGHAAFFGTGAYATAILQVHLGWNPWAALPVAVLAGTAVGAFMGAVSFRYGLRGSYFALVTLAFAEVLRILATSWTMTGGGAGILIPLDLRPANLQFQSRVTVYYVALGLVVAALVLARWLEHGRFGAWLMAIRENEDSAAALGVDAFRCKLAAIAISAAMTALGGVFYAQYFLYLDPGIAYGPRISIEALLVPIIGGLGTAFGPVLGSFVVHGLGELVVHLTGDAPGIALMVYGLLLILILRFLPRGLMGLVRGAWDRRRNAKEAAHA
jgi:branched-chain amino acid transport system permease protein